ncbi:hypothetical protein PGTUg99_029140 [Puccinia graminis f. sp. tritici]|uniref:Uncharacterized protein n=1 Tax=Puccinia graminis f. sp. tritici TaxID=56615 RepID=A0A5B0RNK1_PUCGR|nr:hypothetical protein PGTUg99_029140 [Puccinia graminis f. sp. tritici]
MIGISWGDPIRAAWELGIGIAQADPGLWPADIIWVGLQFQRYTTKVIPHPTTPPVLFPPPHHYPPPTSVVLRKSIVLTSARI